jgi:tRNA (guanine-N7-)-methyltransferase
MGEATAHIARVRPTTISCAAKCTSPAWAPCSSALANKDLTNIRILQHDAVEVIDHMLPQAAWTASTFSFPTPGTRKSTTSAA